MPWHLGDIRINKAMLFLFFARKYWHAVWLTTLYIFDSSYGQQFVSNHWFIKLTIIVCFKKIRTDNENTSYEQHAKRNLGLKLDCFGYFNYFATASVYSLVWENTPGHLRDANDRTKGWTVTWFNTFRAQDFVSQVSSPHDSTTGTSISIRLNQRRVKFFT